jgi:hypothetical protein
MQNKLKRRLNSVSQKTYVNPQGIISQNAIHDLSIYIDRENQSADVENYHCLAPDDENGTRDIYRGSFLFGARLKRHGVSLENHRNVFTSFNKFCVPKKIVDENKTKSDKEIIKAITDHLNENYELIGIANTESIYMGPDMVSQDPTVLLAGLVEITNNSQQNISFSDILFIDWPTIVVKADRKPYFESQEGVHLSGIPNKKITGVPKIVNRYDLTIKAFFDENRAVNMNDDETRYKMVDRLLTEVIDRVCLKSLGHARPGEHFSVKIHGSNTIM